MIKFKCVQIFTIIHFTFCIYIIEVLCNSESSVARCTCGNSFAQTGRIVGGQNATPSEFPWQAAVYDGEFHICGGSLINNMYVMTAVHCAKDFCDESGILRVSDAIQRISVVLGAYEMKALSEYNEEKDNVNVQKVVDFIPHENFNFSTFTNDICLLKLKDPLKEYTRTINPICLPLSSESFVGKSAVICGWGREYKRGDPVSILKKAELEIIEDGSCAYLLGTWYQYGEIMMCTKPHTSGQCYGDSGGPLMVKINSTKYQQVGIMSFGFGCSSLTPNIYTRLSTFKNWIENKTMDAIYCED